ncbi:MAG: ABC transporter permease [Treponemataceae bacterium]|nr:ABC transporter permease [Treponemataceae bacterium]
MFEDFLNALQNFRMNKTRTILSLLGVVIGVASVIVITTLGESATSNITGSFASSGLDLVQISAGFMNRRSSSALSFTEKFREDLWDNIPHLKQIQYTNSISGTLNYGDASANVSATAIENGYFEMYHYTLSEGVDFSVSDNVNGAQKIIVGKDIADALFADGNALGKTAILIQGNVRFGFEIIGILEDSAVAKSVYIPRGFYSKKIEPNPKAASAILQAVDKDHAVAVESAVKSYSERLTGSANSVSVMSMQSLLDQFDEILGTVTMLLSGIAAISLLVGGVGIMNIMIVTVTERRKEIGIRKALGATPGAIRMQFLVESASITLVGGFFGILAGLGISAVAVNVLEWSYAIKWDACLLSFVFSAFVGVFFGLSPAARAAKLDPVEALASE